MNQLWINLSSNYLSKVTNQQIETDFKLKAILSATDLPSQCHQKKL